MYLHVMTNDKFTIPFINFINSNFEISEHKFIIINVNEEINCNISDIRNAFIFNEGEFNKLIKESGQVILHSLFMATNKFYLKLFMNWRNLYKFNWVIWGGDLYNFNNKGKTIKQKILDKFKKCVIRKFGTITTLVKNDYKLAKEYCSVNGKYKEGMYINPVKIEYLDNISQIYRENNDINILLGNSANKSNKHIEAIKLLDKYKHENIKIYVPLSYSGDKKYIEEVISIGKQIFGEKFVPITEFITPDKYGEFLGSIDIAIFNNDRQQALGNIFCLAYLGSKIYMRSDTTMWEQFVNIDGYKFDSMEILESQGFNEFIYKTDITVKNNKKISMYRFDENHIAKIWSKIFNNKTEVQREGK